jgi:hypothetical protein
MKFPVTDQVSASGGGQVAATIRTTGLLTEEASLGTERSEQTTRISPIVALPRLGCTTAQIGGYFSTDRELGQIPNVTWVTVSLAYEAPTRGGFPRLSAS